MAGSLTPPKISRPFVAGAFPSSRSLPSQVDEPGHLAGLAP